MNTYYYDKDARVLLAVDANSNVRILEPINQTADELIEPAPVHKPAKVNIPKSGKGCPECGSPSKHKKDCSKSKANATGTKRKRGEPCEECGSNSSRHKKGCSLATGNDAWAALDQEEKKRAGLMSARQYSQVKTAHNHGMDPTSIAHEMNLTVKEVNTAILSKTFDVYSA